MFTPMTGIQVDKFYPPTDWQDSNNKQIDIRKNAENNSIVLLVGHSADFSKYSLLGLIADVSSGTYDVYIDDVLVGSAITKNTQYDIDFSTINTSYGSATTPEALVLHKVVLKPTTSGETITTFRCARTSGASGTQNQGILWCHFELDNQINIIFLLGAPYPYTFCNRVAKALTSKGDYINNTPNVIAIFSQANNISYIPKLENGATTAGYYLCYYLKRICVNNQDINQTYQFANCSSLEQINIKNKNTSSKSIQTQQMYLCNKLKIFPFNKGFGGSSGGYWVHRIMDLLPTKIDVSSATGLLNVDVSGTNDNTMRGLRGLKVSNEAPFTGASPQINIGYTGLDRDALVELFQNLPTVTGGQTLRCVACSGNNLTKVGSPTIDENGVASGFGASSYIRTTTSMSYNNSFEMFVEFTFGNDITSVNQMILCEQNNNMRLWKLGSENFIKMRFYDSAISDFRSLNLTYAVQPNTTYKCKAVFKNSKLELFLYDGNNNLLEEKSIDNVKVLINQQIKYGSIAASSAYFLGTINLPTTYIKTDSNYLVKGYLIDTDKAIATDKGWGLVLS